jgi:hypothetical protein
MVIPAQTFNTFIDAARDYLQRRQNTGADPQAEPRQMGVVLVKNTTGADRGLFEILAFDGPVYGPDDNEDGFKFHFAFKGITPDTDHAGNFAVLLEPVKDGEIGRACALGVTPVRVDVAAEGDRYADVEDGACGALASAASGAARILWKEDGTGEKWALVRLGGAAGGMLRFANVVGLKNSSNGTWTSFEDDGFVSHVTANPCKADGTGAGEAVLVLKATSSPTEAATGYLDTGLAGVVAYLPGDGTEPVPGDPETMLDGYIVPFAGTGGAFMTARVVD